jgi:hypothetical protein
MASDWNGSTVTVLGKFRQAKRIGVSPIGFNGEKMVSQLQVDAVPGCTGWATYTWLTIITGECRDDQNADR